MTRASSPSPSQAQSHSRPKKQRQAPANTMDEPGGPEAPLAQQEAEEIARAAAKRTREEGSREPARHDEVDPDFKPPMAPDPSGDGEG